MENEKEQKPFIIDTSKIGQTESAEILKKDTIQRVLINLEQKRPFGPNDIVTTLEGPHAHKGLKVIELKENGMVRVAPAPNIPIVEIHESKLFHFDDYQEAFKLALIEEQNLNPEKPQ